MVQVVGVEPTRMLLRRILSPVRLPIPPHLHILLCVLVTASTLRYYSI